MKNQKQIMRRSVAGISLVEVLVATAIFSIGIVAVMRLFPQALTQLQTATQRTVASQLAETELGRVRVATAENLFREQSIMNGSVVSSLYSTGQIFQGYTTTAMPMRGSYQVNSDGDSVGTFLQRVTFTVLMPDGREEVYVTYVAKQ